MAKRTYQNLIGFVQTVSHTKEDGSFRFSFQTSSETVKNSMCFDAKKEACLKSTTVQVMP